MSSIKSQFGDMDIYLFDQLQKGRLEGKRSVIDLGCGGGRNLVYFLQAGWDVYGVDTKPEAISVAQELARSLQPGVAAGRFRLGAIEARPFGGRYFDLVICNAVLHFAEDEEHFAAMLEACWDSVAQGGILFVRTASKVGVEAQSVPLGNGRYRLPDGSDRFLVDDSYLQGWQQRLGAQQLEPIKTTVVEGKRGMTTWVLGRP